MHVLYNNQIKQVIDVTLGKIGELERAQKRARF